jgi:hypothetical protein
MSCCSPDDMLAIYHDLPAEIKARVFSALPESSRRYLVWTLLVDTLVDERVICQNSHSRICGQITDRIVLALRQVSKLSPEELAALLMACNEDERKLILAVVNTDHLAGLSPLFLSLYPPSSRSVLKIYAGTCVDLKGAQRRSMCCRQ